MQMSTCALLSNKKRPFSSLFKMCCALTCCAVLVYFNHKGHALSHVLKGALQAVWLQPQIPSCPIVLHFAKEKYL